MTLCVRLVRDAIMGDWNNLDCRLRNLELLPTGSHPSYERWAWKKKVLKLSVAMVKRVQDDPVAMRLR